MIHQNNCPKISRIIILTLPPSTGLSCVAVFWIYVHYSVSCRHIKPQILRGKSQGFENYHFDTNYFFTIFLNEIWICAANTPLHLVFVFWGIVCKISRSALKPIQRFIPWVTWASIQAVRWSKHEQHSFLSSVEFKNGRSFIATSPIPSWHSEKKCVFLS